MAYDVLSHFEDRTAPAGIDPVFRPIAGWSIWRVDIGDLGRENLFIEEDLVDMGAALVALDQDLHEHARMQIDFRRRIVRGRSGVIEGSDAAGVLRVAAGVRLGELELQLTLTLASEGRTPADVLPALRFLSRLRPESRVGLWLDGLQDWAAPPVQWTFDPAIDEGYLAAVETLDEVQRATGTSFPTPSEFTRNDLEDLRRATTLLSGDVLTSTWTEGTLIVTRSELDTLGKLAPASVGQFEETGTFDITIGAKNIRLGIVSQRLQFVFAEEQEEVPDKPGCVRVRVVPGDDNRMERKLVERAFFDPFARDLERVKATEDDIAHARQAKSLRDHLRSA